MFWHRTWTVPSSLIRAAGTNARTCHNRTYTYDVHIPIISCVQIWCSSRLIRTARVGTHSSRRHYSTRVDIDKERERLICIYVCIYIYIWIHMYIYIYTYMYIGIWIYVYIYIFTYMYTVIYVYMFIANPSYQRRQTSLEQGKKKAQISNESTRG